MHEQTEIDTTGAKEENGIRPAGPFQIEVTDLSGQRATRGHFFRLAYLDKGAKLVLLARLPRSAVAV